MIVTPELLHVLDHILVWFIFLVLIFPQAEAPPVVRNEGCTNCKWGPPLTDEDTLGAAERMSIDPEKNMQTLMDLDKFESFRDGRKKL